MIRLLLFTLIILLPFSLQDDEPTAVEVDNTASEIEAKNDDAEAIYNKTYSEHESQLEKDIFRGYGSLIRPVKNQSERLDVSLHWHLVHASVNQKEQTINIHGHLYMTWKDERLGWDPDDYNGIRITRTKKWMVWHPKISVANSVSGVYSVFEISSQAHVLIQTLGKNEGSKIEMYPTFSIKAGCIFDYSDYPNDENQCAVTVYTPDSSDKINLRVYGPQIPPTIMFGWGKQAGKSIISDFEITNVTTDVLWYRRGNFTIDEPQSAAEAVNSWSMMRLLISFRRHSALFGISVALPSTIAFIITLFAFFILDLHHAVYALTANMIIQAVFLEDLTKTVPLVVSRVPKSIAVYGEIMILNTLAIAIHVALLSIQKTKFQVPPFFLAGLEFFRPFAVGKMTKLKGMDMTWSDAIPLLRPLAAVLFFVVFICGYIFAMIF